MKTGLVEFRLNISEISTRKGTTSSRY